MASDKVANFGDDSFQKEVLDSEVPVLVDFWAPWCAPCRAIAPAVEQLAASYEGRVKVGKLNIDDHPAIPQRYGIRAIPTLLLFKNGDIVDQIMGGVPKSRIEDMIKKAL